MTTRQIKLRSPLTVAIGRDSQTHILVKDHGGRKQRILAEFAASGLGKPHTIGRRRAATTGLVIQQRMGTFDAGDLTKNRRRRTLVPW